MISQSRKASVAPQCPPSLGDGLGLPDPAPGNDRVRMHVGAAAVPSTNGMRHLSFSAKAMIFDEGDQAGSVYVIEGGSILVSKEFDDGRRQIVEMLGPGGVFGITNTNGYVCRAEALRRSRVIAYERDVVENSPTLQAQFSRRLA